MANTIYTVLGNNEGYGSAEYSTELFTTRTIEDTVFAQLHPEYPYPAKGTYNKEDLNRIEQILESLQSRLNGEYGFNLNLAIKKDWVIADEPSQAQMDTYMQNIIDIRTAINTKTRPPNDMANLTIEDANNIEKILHEVENSLAIIQLSWIGSGEIGSGEI